ncbi:MAG: hypothetical protein ACRD63_10695 [Pyrinomonadaceae bacterium]
MSTSTEVLNMRIYDAPTDEEINSTAATQDVATAFCPVQQPIRDQADVRTIMSMAVAGILLVTLLLLLAILLAYKVLSSPPVIVVDRTKEGDRVVSMNGQMLAGSVSVSKDRPGDGDKKYAANKFATYLYQIDPATRSDDLERAIKMMVPAVAVELMKQIKPDLELQRSERWQTIWEPQVASIDPIDPYTVRVVGRQHITKIIRNEKQQESRQLAFNLKVVFDSQHRAERNERTGFLIADLRDFQIISDEPEATASTAITPPSAAEMVPPGQFVQPQP